MVNPYTRVDREQLQVILHCSARRGASGSVLEMADEDGEEAARRQRMPKSEATLKAEAEALASFEEEKYEAQCVTFFRSTLLVRQVEDLGAAAHRAGTKKRAIAPTVANQPVPKSAGTKAASGAGVKKTNLQRP